MIKKVLIFCSIITAACALAITGCSSGGGGGGSSSGAKTYNVTFVLGYSDAQELPVISVAGGTAVGARWPRNPVG